MKLNDIYPINLDQWQVAEARVTAIEGDQVILEIPATRVVMGIKTSLTDLEERTPEQQQVLLGQEEKPQTQVSGNENIASPTPAEPVKVEQAPAIVPAPVDDSVGEGLDNYKLKEME